MEASHAFKEKMWHIYVKFKGRKKGVAKTQIKLLWGFFLGLDFFNILFFFFKLIVCHIIKVIPEK